MIGVEQWAEIRRLYFVEKRSKRAIHRLTGLHRDTITRALAAEAPPRYMMPGAQYCTGFGKRKVRHSRRS